MRIRSIYKSLAVGGAVASSGLFLHSHLQSKKINNYSTRHVKIIDADKREILLFGEDSKNDEAEINLRSGKVNQLLRRIDESHPYFSDVASIGLGYSLAHFTFHTAKKLPISPRIGNTASSVFTVSSLLASTYLLYKIDYAYRSALTAPINPIKTTPYNQLPLTILANLNSDEMLKGLCFGLTYSWGNRLQYNQDILNELANAKDSTALTSVTRIQLDNFPTYAEQMQPTHYAVTKIEWKRHFKDNMHEIAKYSVQEAIQHPNTPHYLYLRLKGSAHIVGVMAKQNTHGYVIKYFDSNYREATFDNEKDAELSVALLLQYGYRKQFKKNILPTHYGRMFAPLKPADILENTKLLDDPTVAEELGSRLVILYRKTP